MERLLMSLPVRNLPIEEEDEGIDMAAYSQQKKAADEAADYEGTIDMAEYAQSREAEEATWWDFAKDVATQPVLGVSQAFTWPLDLLKLGMVGEGLSGIDEIEEAFEKAGKPFDRDKYIKTVAEQAEFIPTQELLEGIIEKKTGWNLTKPKSETGKWLRKLFTIGGLLRGKGLVKAGVGGAVGATTTAGLRAAGAPEFVSELGGDIAGVGAASISKATRNLSPEAARIQQVADKHSLPLIEAMLRDEIPQSPKITAGRKKALEKRLGKSSEEAIQDIIEDRIPAAKLRAQGHDTEILEELAYDHANAVAKNYPQTIPTKDLVSDIDKEISRIKSLAPSPSHAQKAAIKVLEDEKKVLGKAKPNAEQLIEQTRNYNSNVKSIYKKPEYSGVEDEVKNAYAFLNDRIRSSIEKNGASDVVSANRAANKLFAENAAIARTEGNIMKAFKDGQYSPKKLNQVLNSKQGNFLRRDLGDKAVKELRDIAEFGTKAQNATEQFANSAKHSFNVGQYGPLAGFLLAKVPPVGAALVATKPFMDYVRGWALTRPAARTVYRDIIKNAANGSFKPMAADFARLESQVIEEFGSMEEFFDEGVRQLQMYREGEEDED